MGGSRGILALSSQPWEDLCLQRGDSGGWRAEPAGADAGRTRAAQQC